MIREMTAGVLRMYRTILMKQSRRGIFKEDGKSVSF